MTMNNEQELHSDADHVARKRFATPVMIPDIYPGVFSESSIRWLIHNEHENGFDKCVRRVGKKILIDLAMFEAWIDEQRGQ